MSWQTIKWKWTLSKKNKEQKVHLKLAVYLKIQHKPNWKVLEAVLLGGVGGMFVDVEGHHLGMPAGEKFINFLLNQ